MQFVELDKLPVDEFGVFAGLIGVGVAGGGAHGQDYTFARSAAL